MKCIIFNADDFGRSERENWAIVQTIANGPVRSTTVMANMPFASAIRSTSAQFPLLGVGVHLNLTEGRPVLSPHLIPSLVDRNGVFWRKRQLLMRCCLGSINKSEVITELRAQILRVMEWVGEITHVDTHQDILIFPCVMPAILEVLDSLKIQKIRTENIFRIPRSLAKEVYGNTHAAIISDRLFRPLWSVIKKYRGNKLHNCGLHGTNYILMGAPGYGNAPVMLDVILLWWKYVLPQLPDATFEVAVHPGLSPAEVAVLTDPRMTRLLKIFGVRVLNFSDV